MSNDETELAARLKDQGGSIGYAGGALVAHRIDPSRLKQSWFRQRAAWQAVSDFVVAPALQAADAGQHWRNTKKYLAQLPPDQRTLLGLVAQRGNGGDLTWQVGSIYSAVTALLGGADDSDG